MAIKGRSRRADVPSRNRWASFLASFRHPGRRARVSSIFMTYTSTSDEELQTTEEVLPAADEPGDQSLNRLDDSPIEALLRRKMALGFLIALLLPGAMGFLAWHSAQQAASESDWVTHTQLVLTKLEATVRHVVDTETGARGFALIGQETLLQPYEEGQRSLSQDLAELRHLTADNLGQQRRLDVLEPQILVAERFAHVRWRHTCTYHCRARRQLYPGAARHARRSNHYTPLRMTSWH